MKAQLLTILLFRAFPCKTQDLYQKTKRGSLSKFSSKIKQTESGVPSVLRRGREKLSRLTDSPMQGSSENVLFYSRVSLIKDRSCQIEDDQVDRGRARGLSMNALCRERLRGSWKHQGVVVARVITPSKRGKRMRV